ncbi:hypothetical protein PAPYR_2089 [Paratrimastix pyriformis]|uniref:RING-type E3 ubiquitin transferase n=1 Tax=Paratrimastix pyriformis TaxID=342808 RepID=A0ABQ8UTV3_9EUKA|nr:hypothetical protein PAPYR_2089 [Paratrimastix pyriformis]
MSGLSQNRFEHCPAEVICCYCQNVMNDPVVLGCSHKCCRRCVEASSIPHLCPVIENLLIRCEKAPKCEWVGPVAQLGQHTGSCPFRDVECAHCKKLFSTRDHEVHEPQCPKKPLVCECGASTTIGDRQQHLSLTCPKAHVPCPIPGCTQQVPREELSSHTTADSTAQQHLHGALAEVESLRRRLAQVEGPLQIEHELIQRLPGGTGGLIVRWMASLTLPADDEGTHFEPERDADLLVQLIGHPAVRGSREAPRHLLQCLADLSANNSVNQAAFAAAKVGPSLVPLLDEARAPPIAFLTRSCVDTASRSDSEASLEAAFRALLNLAIHPATRLALAHSGLPPVFMRLLSHPAVDQDAFLATAAMWALVNLTSGCPEAEAAYGAAGACALAMHFLGSPMLAANAGLAEQTLWALANLAAGCPSNRASLRQLGVARILCGLLEHPVVAENASVAQQAYRLLANLAADPEVRAALEAAAPSIARIMNNFVVVDYAAVAVQVFRAVTNLATDSPANRAALAKASLGGPMVGLMSHQMLLQSPAVAREALHAVASLAQDAPDNQEQLGRANIGTLLARLLGHPIATENAPAAEWLCTVLAILTRHPANVGLFREQGVYPAVMAFEQLPICSAAMKEHLAHAKLVLQQPTQGDGLSPQEVAVVPLATGANADEESGLAQLLHSSPAPSPATGTRSLA